MRKMKKSINFKLIVISSLLVTFFYVYYSLPYLKKDAYWRNIDVEGVRLSEAGPEYKISDGYLFKGGVKRRLKFELSPFKLIENERVLRVALFYQINHIDPIFSGPGLEVNDLNRSVERLEKIHAGMLTSLGLKKSVVPVNYLQSWGKTVEYEAVFRQTKNFPAAKRLVKSQKKTSEAYGVEAQELAETIKELFPEDKALLQGGSLTTTGILQEDLEKVSENAGVLKKEIRTRNACLRISSVFCRPELPWVPESIELKEYDDQSVLPLSDLYYTKDPKDSVIRGPYRVKTSCWNKENGEKRPQLIYLFEEKNAGFNRLIPKLATQNYYQEIKAGSEEVIDIGYKNHGVPARVMFDTTPYNCNDLTYQPAMATLNYFKSNFKSDLFSRIEKEEGITEELSEIIEEGKKYETQFEKENYPSGESLQNLGRSYSRLYEALAEKTGSSKAMKDHREEALERALIIKTKLANFDGIINFFSYILDGYYQVEKAYGKEEKYDYLYTVRSGYSLFFMGFSSSVWRISSEPRYIESSKPQLRPDLLTREQMIQKYGKEQLDQVTSLTRAQVWKELLGQYVK